MSGNRVEVPRRRTGMTRTMSSSSSRSSRPQPASRRFLLALGVVALGLSACGDPTTSTGTTTQTTVSPSTPPVIEIAGSGPAGSAATSAAPTAEGADSRMMLAPITYVFDGEPPVFEGPSGAWYFPVGTTPTDDQLRRLAAAFGITGDPRVLPADQGGGWALGSTDGTGPGLQVSAGATLDWWYYPEPTIAGRGAAGCAVVAGVDPPVGDDAAVAPPTPDATVVGPAPDAPTCIEPEPPSGVPGEDEALAKARDLFAAVGLDVSGYDVSVIGDEWGRTVTLAQLLDGHRSPVAQSVGFGENGAVTWAGGVLAQPVRGADYPRITIAEAVQRLNEQWGGWGTFGPGVAVDTAPGGAVVGDGGGAAIEPALGAPEIAPDGQPVCVDPAVLAAQSTEGGAVGAAPPDSAVEVVDPSIVVDPVPCEVTPAEPITVHLSGVTEGLTMVWAADNTIWLLPAYDFTSDDGGQYQVNAVADEFIENVPAETRPVPEPAPADSVSVDPGTSGGAEVPTIESAALLVGLTEAAATDAATARGWTLRVGQRDGEALAVTADYSATRVNVAVDGDVVTAVLGTG